MMKLAFILISAFFLNLILKSAQAAPTQVCGPTLALALEISRPLQRATVIESHRLKDDTTCLIPGAGPANANFKIELTGSADNKVLFSQLFFLSKWEYYDGDLTRRNQSVPKNEGDKGGARLAQRPQFKNINLPILNHEGKLQYKIIMLKGNRLMGQGEIP